MGVLDLLDEECKVCVRGLSQRERSSAVLLLGLTGTSHLQTVVILTLTGQEFGKHTNRTGNYRRRKNCFSNELFLTPSRPSCICSCSCVSDQLCLNLDSFPFPEDK